MWEAKIESINVPLTQEGVHVFILFTDGSKEIRRTYLISPQEYATKDDFFIRVSADLQKIVTNDLLKLDFELDLQASLATVEVNPVNGQLITEVRTKDKPITKKP